MELEEAIKKLKTIYIKGQDINNNIVLTTLDLHYIGIVLNYIENSVPKKKLEEFIEQNAYTDTYNFKTIEVSKLRDLLEDK